MLASCSRSGLEEGLDLPLQQDRKWLAAAIKRLADRGANPAFRDAVFLDIRTLHPVEADADVPVHRWEVWERIHADGRLDGATTPGE